MIILKLGGLNNQSPATETAGLHLLFFHHSFFDVVFRVLIELLLAILAAEAVVLTLIICAGVSMLLFDCHPADGICRHQAFTSSTMGSPALFRAGTAEWPVDKAV
jgi:hypothetical protein